jgi:hypothetical protein
MPVVRDSPSIQGDVPGPDPARAPLTRRSPRRLACRGSRRGSTLPAKVREAQHRCPRERGGPGPRLVHIPAEPSGSQRSPVVSSDRSFAQVADAILRKQARGRTLIRMRSQVQVLAGPPQRHDQRKRRSSSRSGPIRESVRQSTEGHVSVKPHNWAHFLSVRRPIDHGVESRQGGERLRAARPHPPQASSPVPGRPGEELAAIRLLAGKVAPRVWSATGQARPTRSGWLAGDPDVLQDALLEAATATRVAWPAAGLVSWLAGGGPA